MADVRQRRREYWFGLVAVIAALVVVVLGAWPVPARVTDGSFVHALLGDETIIGLLRLAIVVAALYGIASVPVLVAGGRWIKGLGTSGIVADDARSDVALALEHARQEVAVLQALNADLIAERARLRNLVPSRRDRTRMKTVTEEERREQLEELLKQMLVTDERVERHKAETARVLALIDRALAKLAASR